MITDILSACGIILMALLTALYGKASVKLKKRRALFFTVTLLIMLLYAACFIGWSFYNRIRFGQALSFLRFCPFGTAFFFLQGIRFVSDIFSGKASISGRMTDSLEYLLFYPRLVMGPVASYAEHRAMLSEGAQCSERIGEGLGFFIKGLAKKVLLADTVGIVFSPLYGTQDSEISLVMSWITILAFALEFYFTVAGYGDMAKGIALCYGFRLPDSYGTPLLSGSLSRFGDEWNISVVSWCKGCFTPMLRSLRWQSIIGTMGAWILLGCWYRQEPHLIIWGAWMGFWIGLDKYLKNRFKRIPSVLYGALFFIVTFFGWAFFSADSLSSGIHQLGMLLGSSGSIISSKDLYFISSGGVMLLIAFYSATGNFTVLLDRIRRIPILSRISSVIALPIQLLLLFLCIVMLVTHNDIDALQWKGVM